MHLGVLVLGFYCAALLSACGGRHAVAPVADRDRPARAAADTPRVVSKTGYHQVQRGETLYSIAWKYGRDYKDVAQWNRISPPYRIYVGQNLLVAPPGAAAPPAPTTVAQQPTTPASPPASPVLAQQPQPTPPATEPSASVADDMDDAAPSVVTWGWPAEGEVLQGGGGDKGLNIAGHERQPIRAAAAGRVVYAGNSIVRLGELVIVKHDKSFISAYAHNKKILVKEGDKVAAGQTIAEMGKSGAERVMLYFEIRKDGKPVDPLLYLPKRR
ncbi:MAG: peptidoglycan DD-metalloendopeptidase family protein [Pseudomonadota bacterium]